MERSDGMKSASMVSRHVSNDSFSSEPTTVHTTPSGTPTRDSNLSFHVDVVPDHAATAVIRKGSPTPKREKRGAPGTKLSATTSPSRGGGKPKKQGIPQLSLTSVQLGEASALASARLGTGRLATGRRSVRMTMQPAVPKLPIHGLATLFERDNAQALTSARDILVSARDGVTTTRTQRLHNGNKSVEELQQQLEASEERALSAAETGMQLLTRIHDLEEEIEDKDEEISMLKSEQTDLVQEIRTLKMTLTNYKADRIYTEEQMLQMRRDKEDMMGSEAWMAANADNRLEAARWAERKAVELVKDAKRVAASIPVIESDELAARFMISAEEGKSRSETNQYFLHHCVKDASMLYRAVRRFNLDPNTVGMRLPMRCTESMVLKRTKYLRRWKPCLMTLDMEHYRCGPARRPSAGVLSIFWELTRNFLECSLFIVLAVQ
ncbi:hypothetical protein DIPPA_16399 [Diplonema papillatum]|nr:hypothetical protein DIPPA_16399 [Diplonema papillatum]